MAVAVEVQKLKALAAFTPTPAQELHGSTDDAGMHVFVVNI